MDANCERCGVDLPTGTHKFCPECGYKFPSPITIKSYSNHSNADTGGLKLNPHEPEKTMPKVKKKKGNLAFYISLFLSLTLLSISLFFYNRSKLKGDIANSVLKSENVKASTDLSILSQKVSPCVVTLICSDSNNQPKSSGSGFFIDSTGTIVTNHHVIDGESNIIVKCSNGSFFPVKKIVAINPKADLAMVSIEANNLPFVELGSTNDLNAGRDVFVISTPKKLEQTLSSGIISAIRNNEEGMRQIQMTTPIYDGSSGSPVFTMDCKVVGVTVSRLNEATQGFNFAIPIEYLKEMKDHPENYAVTIMSDGQALTTDKEFGPIIAKIISGKSSNTDKLYLSTMAKKMTDKYPKNALAWCIYGDSLYYNEMYQDAISAYLNALSINENDGYPCYQIGDCYHRLYINNLSNGQDFDLLIKAERFLRESVKLNGTNSEAWKALGLVFFKEKKYQDSINALKKSVALNNKDYEAYEFLGLACDNAGDFQASMIAYQAALSLNDKDVRIYEDLANIALKIKNYTAFWNYVNKGMSLDSRNIVILKYAIIASIELRNSQYARLYQQKLYQISPTSAMDFESDIRRMENGY